MAHPKVIHPKELLEKENSFDRRLARRLGDVLGSMKFFYFCVLLDLAMLPPVITTGSVTLWVTYLAQTVIQLLALPVLQVYQNIQEELANAKSDADHVAFTHVAQVSDSNAASLEKVINSLDIDTKGGLQVIYSELQEIKNAWTKPRTVNQEA